MCSDSSKSKLTVNGKFRLWKPRFDDLIITSEQQFKTKIGYIHNNPVKSGIVNHPGDYGYSSASDWLNNERGLLPVAKDFSFLK
jgi:hypothetical protein